MSDLFGDEPFGIAELDQVGHIGVPCVRKSRVRWVRVAFDVGVSRDEVRDVGGRWCGDMSGIAVTDVTSVGVCTADGLQSGRQDDVRGMAGACGAGEFRSLRCLAFLATTGSRASAPRAEVSTQVWGRAPKTSWNSVCRSASCRGSLHG